MALRVNVLFSVGKGTRVPRNTHDTLPHCALEIVPWCVRVVPEENSSSYESDKTAVTLLSLQTPDEKFDKTFSLMTPTN